MNDRRAIWARHQVAHAVMMGYLTRPEICEKCNGPNVPMRDGRSSIQAHHHNGYDDPLDVQWICVKCHRKETPTPIGEKAGAAKLTWEKVASIRARHASGEGYYLIAADVGVDPTTIHRVITGRSWPEHARPQRGREQ